MKKIVLIILFGIVLSTSVLAVGEVILNNIGMYDELFKGPEYYWCDAYRDGSEGGDTASRIRMDKTDIIDVDNHDYVCFENGIYETIAECCGDEACYSSTGGERYAAGQRFGGNWRCDANEKWIEEVDPLADIILKLIADENTHAEPYNGTNFPVEIKYSDIFGSPFGNYGGQITGNPHPICDSQELINLRTVTNAHAEQGDLSNYPFALCYGDLQCTFSNICAADETCVVALSGSTNAHLAKCDSPLGLMYNTKVCCKSSFSICGPEVCDNGIDDDCDSFVDNLDSDCPGCPPPMLICPDGSCQFDCPQPDVCNGNGICEFQEGCGCDDCYAEQDSCTDGAHCDPIFEICVCDVGKTLCLDGICRDTCPVPLGCVGAPDAICELGEGCACDDCMNEQDSCGFGCVCDPLPNPNDRTCAVPSGNCFCDDGTCRPPGMCDCIECLDEFGDSGPANGICDPGEGCGCPDCEGEKANCAYPAVCYDGICIDCQIQNTFWSEPCVGENQDVELIVEALDACDGHDVEIVIYESEPGADTLIADLGSVTFSGYQARTTWNAQWFDDGFMEGNPEYYFVTKFKTMNTITSSELSVEHCIPSCDLDCDGFCDYVYRGTGVACLADIKAHSEYTPASIYEDYCELDSGFVVIDANSKSEYCEDCDPYGLSRGQETCAAFFDCTPGWWGDTVPSAWTDEPWWGSPWNENEISNALRWGECDYETLFVSRYICPSGNLSDPLCCSALGGQDNCFCKIPNVQDLEEHNCDQSRFKPVQEKACLLEESFPFFSTINVLVVVMILFTFYIFRRNSTKSRK